MRPTLGTAWVSELLFVVEKAVSETARMTAPPSAASATRSTRVRLRSGSIGIGPDPPLDAARRQEPCARGDHHRTSSVRPVTQPTYEERAPGPSLVAGGSTGC